MKSPGRNEWLALAGIVLLGCGLRLAFLDRTAVEHFDEGVYASNVWFGPPNYEYPNRHLYAPPLVPTLIETVFQICGPSNIGAMSVSLTLGCLTIPLVWWVGRSWHGPAAGLVAAFLCAASSPHALLSRTCLTDVPFCFSLLLAVYILGEGVRRPSLPLTLAGGVATALAWWTKYNGWLPLAIAGLAALVWKPEESSPSKPDLVRRLALVSLGALVAISLWSPVLSALQPRGGYAAVMANHRQYVVGFRGWLGSLAEMAWDRGALNVEFGGAEAFLLAFGLGCRWLSPRFTWNAGAPLFQVMVLLWIALAGLLGNSCGPWVLLVALALPGTGLRRDSADPLLASWLVVFCLLTPLYRPYPRLELPIEIGVWLALGRQVSAILKLQVTRRSLGISLGSLTAVLVMAFMSIVGSESEFQTRSMLASLSDRRGLQDCAAKVRARIASDAGRSLILDVYGEPAMLFQLRLLGLKSVNPVEHLGFASRGAPRPDAPTFLVTGPHAERSAAFASQFAEARDRLELVAEYEWKPSPVVALDEWSTAPRVPSKFRLWRLR